MRFPWLSISFLTSLSFSLSAAEQRLADCSARGDVLTAYYRYKGVRSVILVACAEDFGYATLSCLAEQFFACGFQVHIISKDLDDLHLLSVWHKTGLVLNFNSHSQCTYNLSSAILRRAGLHNHFTAGNFWMSVVDDGDLHLPDVLGDVFIPPNGDAKVLIMTQAVSVLLDVYRVSPALEWQTQIVAENFSDSRSMVEQLRRGEWESRRRRKDLGGISLRAGVVVFYSDVFTFMGDLRLRHLDTVARFNYPIAENLRMDLNFRLNGRQLDNYGWQTNGSSFFSGLIGHLQRKELDYGQNALFMRLDRMAAVDFVGETYNIRAAIMFRQPPLSAVANIFAMTFEWDVWTSVAVFSVVTVLSLFAMLLWAPERLEMCVLDCVVFALGTVCQQSFFVDVRSHSGRILVITTFITTLFLFTSFSANIVALLQSPSEAIADLAALTDSPLGLGVHDNPYNRIYFNESSTDETVRALVQKKIAPKGEQAYMRPEEGIRRMRSEMFAFQVERQTGYQIISETFSEPEKCSLKELEPFQLPVMAIPVAKHFLAKELFRQRLRWQRETGLIQREVLRWIPQRPKCANKMGDFVSIGLSESRFPFKLFLCGVLMAVCTLTLEVVCKRVALRRRD